MNWNTIYFLLTLLIMNSWYSYHITYILAFSQADCDTDIYLSLPPGFKVKNSKEGIDYCIKLKKNLYGACQASTN